MMTAPDASHPPSVDADVPCVGCRYNLRTLPIIGTCPECGASIEESLWDLEVHQAELGLLRANDESWRRSMLRGMTIACFGSLLAVSGILLDLSRSYYGLSRGLLFLTPSVTVYVFGCWAAWVLATPRDDRYKSLLTRFCIVTSVVALAFLYLNSAWQRYYLEHIGDGTVGSSLLRGVLPSIGRYISVAWPLTTVFAFGRIVQLAWLARRRKTAAWVGILGAAAALLATLLAAYLIIQSWFSPASSQLMVGLVSPTGSTAFVWAIVGSMVNELRYYPQVYSVRGARVEDFLSFTLGFACWLAVATHGLFLLSIRRSIQRSLSMSPMPRPASATLTIPPSESRAANSPPSPSPHRPQ